MSINATWKKHPHSGDFNDPANWNINLVPTNTATFGFSDHTHLFLSASTDLAVWQFKKGAPNYSFDIHTGVVLTFEGSGGIFIKDSRVGITNEGTIDFKNGSTAGKAHITNNNTINFQDSSFAGSARITNNDALSFNNGSGAAQAHIVNNAGIDFFNFSIADHAHILNNGTIIFADMSSAFSSVITTTSGGSVLFANQSDGVVARLIAKAGAQVDFSTTTGSGGTGIVQVGSISGAGDFHLGSNNLLVGHGAVSGGVLDGGFGGGTGAELEKTGAGTLKLSHPGNTYSGGTDLDEGTFDVAALGAAGTGTIAFPMNAHGVLKIQNAALHSVAPHSSAFDNKIDAFARGDAIDLPGLKFVKHATVTFQPGVFGNLFVKSGKVTDLLTLTDPGLGTFKVKDDGHGGTKVFLKLVAEKPVADTGLADTQTSSHHHDNFQFRGLAGSLARHDLDTAHHHDPLADSASHHQSGSDADSHMLYMAESPQTAADFSDMHTASPLLTHDTDLF
jgi:autotransporter-associated beta strand protein